jgi:hypothetical protein
MITAKDMRMDIDLLNETIAMKSRILKERFLDDDGPSIVMGKAIENIGLHLSTMESIYKSGAKDRDAIKTEFIDNLKSICDLCLDSISKLNDASPEDNNKGI